MPSIVKFNFQQGRKKVKLAAYNRNSSGHLLALYLTNVEDIYILVTKIGLMQFCWPNFVASLPHPSPTVICDASTLFSEWRGKPICIPAEIKTAK